MKSFFCIDLQRFMLIPTKFPLSPNHKTIFLPYGYAGRDNPSIPIWDEPLPDSRCSIPQMFWVI